MKVKYYTKQVYGARLEYVEDKELAQTLQLITGKKTISKSIRENLEKLGVTFERVFTPFDDN